MTTSTPTRYRPGLRRLRATSSAAGLGGLLLDFDRMPDRLARIVAETDGVAQTRWGPGRVAVVADPALARGLLAMPQGTGPGRGTLALRFTLRDGLLTSNGDLHKRQRRLVQPSFHPSRLADYAADAVSVAAGRSARWVDGERVDLAEEMSDLTLDVVGRALFGADLTEDIAQIKAGLNELLATFPRLLKPAGMLAARLPTPLGRSIRRSADTLDVVVERVIATRRAGPAHERPDIVSTLLAARDEATGEPMPVAQVRDEVMTLMLAGYETTAVALAWAWVDLARHPRQRARLDAELASASGARALAAGAWEQLPVTRAVIAETIRLHPPVYAMGREAIEDITLGAHRIARGTLVLVSPYGMHRDPRSWPDPLTWDPQRWLQPDGSYDEARPGQPRGAYLPFGAGPRICIGAAFATMEAVLVLGTLARSWRPEIAPDVDPGTQPAVTLRPRHAIPATLRRVDQ